MDFNESSETRRSMLGHVILHLIIMCHVTSPVLNSYKEGGCEYYSKYMEKTASANFSASSGPTMAR